MQRMSPELKERLAIYVKADRQWKRYHRLKFARLMLKYVKSNFDNRSAPEEIAFWSAVISVNSDDGYDHQWKQPKEIAPTRLNDVDQHG